MKYKLSSNWKNISIESYTGCNQIKSQSTNEDCDCYHYCIPGPQGIQGFQGPLGVQLFLLCYYKLEKLFPSYSFFLFFYLLNIFKLIKV